MNTTPCKHCGQPVAAFPVRSSIQIDKANDTEWWHVNADGQQTVMECNVVESEGGTVEFEYADPGSDRPRPPKVTEEPTT